jgi:hypothetical protein
MEKETLEESSEKYENKDQHQRSKLDFIEGAKWMQERMYSEEEVRRAFQDGQDNMNHSEMYGWSSKLTEQEWFNQFKKTK